MPPQAPTALMLVYDAGTQFLPDRWWVPLLPLLIIPATVWLGRARSRGAPRRISRPAARWTIAGAALLALLGAGSQYSEHWELRRRLEHRTYLRHEGVVIDFVPAASGGRPRESWCLVANDGRICFSYSPYQLSPGYSRTAADGGLIHEGAYVRVAEVDGVIGMLEIAR